MLKTQAQAHVGVEGRSKPAFLERVDAGRLMRAALTAGLLFLLAHARMLLGLAPFALALFAAGLSARVHPVAMLLGCALGTLRFPLTGTELLLPVGCAIVLLGMLVLDRQPVRARINEGALCALLAGLGTLLPGLVAAQLQPYPAFLALLSACVAVLSAPALRLLLFWRPGRDIGTDGRACAALLLFAVLMGACALWPPGAYLLACLGTLAAAHASLGAAAALGALSLCALLAGGGTLVMAASAGLGGAAAGVLRPRGRPWAAPAFVVCAALIGLYAPADYPGPFIPALAALAYVLAPGAWLNALAGTLFRAPPHGRALREEATRALDALSAAFGELAAGVGNLPDEQAVLLTMRGRICEACPSYGRCWAGEDADAVRLFCQALRDAACTDAAGDRAEEEVPPDTLRICRRGVRLQEVARQEAGRVRMRRDADACAGEMFRQAERILGDLARTRVRPREPPRLAVHWGASARSLTPGTPSGDAHLLRPLPDGRLMALICDGMGTGEAARAESERAVRLIWRFLAARVEPEAALKAANALLIRRGAGDMFATVDLCLIDVRAGRAQFWKLAASRSLLVRKGEVRAIEGGRLPLGVLEGVTGVSEEVDVREGDVIIMGSDGAMEAGEGVLEDALKGHLALGPDKLSEELLRAAEAATEGGHRDDMTVVCIGAARARAP